MKNIPPVLTIAGSDSSGGAGIQADLKTMTSLGCYGMTVITALTSQNTLGVHDVLPIPSSFVRNQLESIFSDIIPKAIKIGMIHDSELITTVASFLKNYRNIPLVLDPVMVASSGDPLLEPAALEALQQELLPLSTLITPNRAEAELLIGTSISSPEDMEKAGETIAQSWKIPVLVKGGDFDNSEFSQDVLFLPGDHQPFWFKTRRIQTENTHGTGCTLSSAIASHLARGEILEKAIEKSKQYIQSAIEHGKDGGIGTGRGPVNHLWSIKGVMK